MAEYIDYSQYEKYEKIAVFVQPNISSNLINTYQKYIEGKPAGDYIFKNYIEPIKPSENYSSKGISILDIIAICIYIALSKENIDQAIHTYKENRRVYKRNWFAPIKEEIQNKMKPKNPGLLRRYAETMVQIQNMNRNILVTQSVEEIMNEKYLEIDKWRTDAAALITDFLFVSEKPSKTLANGFVNDITYESLKIIMEDFGGSIEGFTTRVANDFLKPIFSYRSTAMEFEAELIQNELSFFQTYQTENENDTISDIQVKYNPDVKLPAIVTKENVPNIMSKYNIDLKQKDLDTRDREIMTQLFNMINGETLSNPIIHVDLREFAKKIFNVKSPKQKHYEELGNRLQKLKSYDYTISIKDKKSGEVIETTSLGLLNFIYLNFEDNYFQFTPSEQWLRAYVQKQYVNLLSSDYNVITSSQTKSIMVLLQQERIAEFNSGSSTKILTLKYFRSHMKLLKMTNAALVKELTRHFTILKKEKIVVKDFDFINKNSAVRILFYPLDEKELLAYDFNEESINDKIGVVESPYIEISEKAEP